MCDSAKKKYGPPQIINFTTSSCSLYYQTIRKLAVHPNPVKVMLKGKENRVHEHKAKT